MGPVLVLGCALAAAPVPTGPQGPRPAIAVPPRPTLPTLGVGPRLARALRRAPGSPRLVLARHTTEAAVRFFGGEVVARLGPVLAIRVPGREAAERLADAGASLELGAPLRPSLELSRVWIRADETDFGGFELPLRGRGALVGVYDSGADLSHPDLRDLEGRSRVVAAWDQASGERCEEARIASGACPFEDPSGHGTHVSSIAVGSGPLHRGIAPEAELAVVRSDDFSALIPALVFLRDAARARDRPLVVSLSLGGHVGPHDGTSAEAAALDALGHLAVVAAGNEAGLGVHAGATLTAELPRRVAIALPTLPTLAELEVWGAPGAELVAALVAVEGGATVWSSGPLRIGDLGRTATITLGGGVHGTVALDAEPGPSRDNGRPHLALELLVSSDPGATLALELSGSGEVHAWIDAPAAIPVPARFSRVPVGLEGELLGDDERSISDLACAKSALAVSALITRPELGEPGRLAGFSSRGPSLDPARTGPKPDITAPGAFIVAAASHLAPPPDGALYAARAGTSMAVPHVAGAAAVLLGARPELDPAALRALLLEGAAPPPDTDARWGAGTVDVARSAALAGATPSSCACAETPRGPAPLVLLGLLATIARRRRRGR